LRSRRDGRLRGRHGDRHKEDTESRRHRRNVTSAFEP
jgi:hypothetical protein